MESLSRRVHHNHLLCDDHDVWHSWVHVREDYETVRWYMERAGGHSSYDDDRGYGYDRHDRYHHDASRIGTDYRFNGRNYAPAASRNNFGVRIQLGSPSLRLP